MTEQYRSGQEHAVTISLWQEPVRRPRGGASNGGADAGRPNVSTTVEPRFVALEPQFAGLLDETPVRASDRERQIAGHIAADLAFVARPGSVADQVSNL